MIKVHTIVMWHQPELYDKCLAVIRSCKSKSQLEVSRRYIELARDELGDYCDFLEKEHETMRINLRF